MDGRHLLLALWFFVGNNPLLNFFNAWVYCSNETDVMALTIKKILSWCIHCFTASSAVLGLWALYFITQQQIKLALFLMMLTVIIDSIDGPIARAVDIAHQIPDYDGALLDNIVDFFTWALVPCFLLLLAPIFPFSMTVVLTTAIILASCYQFCCTDAKISGKFFKRYPSAWSATIITLYLLPWPAMAKFVLLVLYVVLSFVPIYVPKATASIRLFSEPLGNMVFNVINLLLQAVGVILILIGLAIYPRVNMVITIGLSLLFVLNFILWMMTTMALVTRDQPVDANCGADDS